MTALFYVHATIAVLAMAWAMFTPQAVHALLFAVLSLLSLAVSMYSLSAEVAAALEVIIYAGAILVLFVFAIMLLKPDKLISERIHLRSKGNGLMLLIMLAFFGEVFWVLRDGFGVNEPNTVSIADIAQALFHTYGFYVEVISFVLLAGFVTAVFVAKSLSRARKPDEV